MLAINITNQKKAGMAILISDKAGFRAEECLRNKEGHYIMVKGSILQKGITIFIQHESNIRASKYTTKIYRTLRIF